VLLQFGQFIVPFYNIYHYIFSNTSECRSLKAILERQARRTQTAQGRYKIDTDTIYIDAPIEQAIAYLQDLRNLDEWAHLLRPSGKILPQSGEFLDEYNQKVKVTFRTHDLNNYYLIEQDYYYPDYDLTQRCPAILISCSYAFGNSAAQGCIQHRLTFWEVGKTPRHGKLQIEDFGAESMNIKRMLEAKAGNLETFARGMSYVAT
jgi:hypothetical protein